MASVYLVRHADAGDREGWTGPDSERPLTDKGWRQARALVPKLRKFHIERIFSSPYLRCRQTVEPLAEATRLEIEIEPRLAEGAPWREAVEWMAGLQQNSVLCSQGDVIEGVVMHLVDQDVIPVAETRWQKGSTWALEVRDRRVVEARYIPRGE
jgi:8-oxo-dGTP diphosphatase